VSKIDFEDVPEESKYWYSASATISAAAPCSAFLICKSKYPANPHPIKNKMANTVMPIFCLVVIYIVYTL